MAQSGITGTGMAQTSNFDKSLPLHHQCFRREEGEPCGRVFVSWDRGKLGDILHAPSTTQVDTMAATAGVTLLSYLMPATK